MSDQLEQRLRELYEEYREISDLDWVLIHCMREAARIGAEYAERPTYALSEKPINLTHAELATIIKRERAAERARIIAELVDTADSIVLDGTHSVDYWMGFRDALECFARNLATEKP